MIGGIFFLLFGVLAALEFAMFLVIPHQTSGPYRLLMVVHGACAGGGWLMAGQPGRSR